VPDRRGPPERMRGTCGARERGPNLISALAGGSQGSRLPALVDDGAGRVGLAGARRLSRLRRGAGHLPPSGSLLLSAARNPSRSQTTGRLGDAGRLRVGPAPGAGQSGSTLWPKSVRGPRHMDRCGSAGRVGGAPRAGPTEATISIAWAGNGAAGVGWAGLVHGRSLGTLTPAHSQGSARRSLFSSGLSAPCATGRASR